MQSLLQTDAEAWGWVNKTPLTSANLMTIKDRTYNKITDIPGPLTIAGVYDGGTVTDPATKAPASGTRIVIVGSAHFLENDAAESVGSNFFTNVLDWLVKKDAVLNINPKRPTEYGVSLSPMQARTVTWMALFFIPGLALALGIFTWFSRRK